jgi:acetyl esterase/lipase
MVALRDQGLPLPSGAILFSPWTDMTASGASFEANERSDVWLSRAHCRTWASYYVGDMDPNDARVSPLHADLHGLPPLLFLVGEQEVLFDDARQAHENALAAGTGSALHVGRRMQHDWPLTMPWLEESRDAWSSIAAFVARYH